VEYLFGSGFADHRGFDKHFSSGLFSLLYEVGVVGLISMLLLVFLIFKKRKISFFLFFLGLLVFEPYKFPVVFMGLILVSYRHRVEFPIKKLAVRFSRDAQTVAVAR